MKIPDILYSGLGWSVVLLSRREHPLPPGAVALIGLPLAFPYPRARSRSPTRSHAHTPYTLHTLATLITYFCISYRCSRGPHLLAKREYQEDRNRWCASARVSARTDATTRRFDTGEAETDVNVSYCHCKRITLKNIVND